ncbi:MAG: mammalian cell entry protein [Burkholderiales bacterium PBB3]|nr:MAG: mammalian cell entry protein [Burkholderiales bacterium PBB3]
METKVNYALVGAFVLTLGAVLVAGVLWLAAGGAWQKKYDTYLAVVDESVAGLNLDAPVKYNGVDVGKVQAIALDPNHPQRVNLLFAIARGTPIKEDTVATLKTQGLTGIAYVELSGGTLGASALQTLPDAQYPQIRSAPSLSARLENVLTNVLAKLDSTSTNINAMLSQDNQAALRSALSDIAVVARTIAVRKDSIDTGLLDAAASLKNTAKASAKMNALVDRVGRGADAVEKMGNSVAATSQSAGKTVDAVGVDMKRISTETLPELERLLAELTSLSGSLRALTDQTRRDPRGLIFGRTPVPGGPGEQESQP